MDPTSSRRERTVARLAWALAAGLVTLGCASPPATDDVSTGPAVGVAAGSPWKGLTADEAVDRFLTLAIPYDMSNAYLVGHLAESYDESLVPALTAKLDALDREGSQADLPRFLLVRVGCRWAYRLRDDAFAVVLTDELREQRRALLRRLGETLEELETPRYRVWLQGVDEDRACVESIDDLEVPETPPAPAGRAA